MPLNGQNSPATDSACTLHDRVGNDATAKFENDPMFIASNLTGIAFSENLRVADDVDIDEDDETEEDDLEDDDLEDVEDEDEFEDDDEEVDEVEDDDDDLEEEDDDDLEDEDEDDDEAAEVAAGADFRPIEQRRTERPRYFLSVVRC